MNDKPELKDLFVHITPHYGAYWKVIGTLLGIHSGKLDIIESDNRHSAANCCNTMLKKWLEEDTTATWGKVFTVLESPAVSCCKFSVEGVYNFMYTFCMHYLVFII